MYILFANFVKFTEFIWLLALEILAPINSYIHIHIVLNSHVRYYYDMITKFLNQHLLFLESEETTPLSFGLCRGG